MKTERRHELQHNVLADSLVHGVETVKPYSQLVLGGLLALVVVFGVYRYWNTRSTASDIEAWNAYLAGSNAATAADQIKNLSEVSEKFPSTPAAAWAEITLADRYLQQAQQQMFTNRADANSELKKAEEAYAAGRVSATDPLLKQRATLGLARVFESQVKIDEAKKEYKLLADDAACPYSALAKTRLDDLEKKSTAEFYDWWRAQETKSPLDSIPSDRPAFDLDKLPDGPGDIGSTLPELDPTKSKATDKPAESTIPPTEKPAEPAPTTPPAEKPAGEPPAAPKP